MTIYVEKPETIIVSLAVNNDNGSWDYNIDYVQFEDFADVAPEWTEAQAEIHDNHLYIGYLKLPYTHHQSCYGNMRYEGFWMARSDAEQLAEYLRRRNYVPEAGEPSVYDAWNLGNPIKFEQAQEA